ncbi:MAG: hypothetical protein ACR2K1_03395 [Saprospiraceae bacterium]
MNYFAMILAAAILAGCASKTDAPGALPADVPTSPILLYPAELAQVSDLAARFCDYANESDLATLLDVDACEDARMLVHQLQSRAP